MAENNNDDNTTTYAAVGAAAVGVVALLWALLNGDQSPLPGTGGEQQMGLPSISNPVDGVTTYLDNTVGEAVGRVGTTLDLGTEATLGELGLDDELDTLVSGAEELAPEAIGAVVPEFAVGRGAVNAGQDLFDDVTGGAGGSSGGGSSGGGGGSGSEPDISPGEGGWSGIDAPDPEPADPDPVSDPQDRLNDTDGDGETDTIDLGGLY